MSSSIRTVTIGRDLRIALYVPINTTLLIERAVELLGSGTSTRAWQLE